MILTMRSKISGEECGFSYIRVANIDIFFQKVTSESVSFSNKWVEFRMTVKFLGFKFHGGADEPFYSRLGKLNISLIVLRASGRTSSNRVIIRPRSLKASWIVFRIIQM